MTQKRYIAVGLGAAITLASGFIGLREGFVNHVYRDSVGVATYCYGETRNPVAGKVYTRQECDATLAKRVTEFDTGVRACVHRLLPTKVEAAFDSLAYNIGLGAFCGSTLVRQANNGDLTAACNGMVVWNKAGKRALPGLTVRRGAERALCLEGVSEGLN